jgi:site-specific recombinase
MVTDAQSKRAVAKPPSSDLLARLAALDPELTLARRLDSVEELARWVIEVPAVKRLLRPAPLQLERLQQLIDVVKTDATLRRKLSATLGSIFRDTSAVHLFSEAGLPSDRGIATETIDRISRRILPRPPDDENLERLVSRIFRRPRDCAWIAAAPIEMFVELAELLGDIWGPLRDAVADAIALLCTRVSALGLSADLRERSEQMLVRDSPFFRLPHVPLEEIPLVVLECRKQLDVIHKRLETTGVSVDVVYCIDAIRKMTIRIERMVTVITGIPAQRVAESRILFDRLTTGRIADDSIRQLGRQNLGLLARKIIERVGHTGEHYVTSSRKEYFKMFTSAAGGGALTAITVIFKFLTKWQHFAPFIDGFLSAGNYAASFVAMQFLGFTLATKQPSMTAASLAATIRETKGEHQLDELVSLIARISRSQFAAACGNVLTVIPVALIIDQLYMLSAGHHFLDEKTATASIASFHPLHTGTIFFAALTGVLLWMSSLGAGWLENWVTYRRLPDALRHHRWGAKVLGRRRMEKIADFVVNHSAGIGGNCTLGFLLGMTPIVGLMFGLPIDVRHITLSTGSLAFSTSALGIHALTAGACIGILVIGLMNFGVSFALALTVALRAREVTGRERLNLASMVLRAFLRKPLRFFWPPKPSTVPGRPGTDPPVAGH